jgi:hypothetical protein
MLSQGGRRHQSLNGYETCHNNKQAQLTKQSHSVVFFSTRSSWGTRVESIGHGDLQSDAKMENKSGYPADDR